MYPYIHVSICFPQTHATVPASTQTLTRYNNGKVTAIRQQYGCLLIETAKLHCALKALVYVKIVCKQHFHRQTEP